MPESRITQRWMEKIGLLSFLWVHLFTQHLHRKSENASRSLCSGRTVSVCPIGFPSIVLQAWEAALQALKAPGGALKPIPNQWQIPASAIHQGKCHAQIISPFRVWKASELDRGSRLRWFGGGNGPILQPCRAAVTLMEAGVTGTHVFLCKACKGFATFLQKGSCSSCETGGWFTALFRRRCFHS